MGRTSLGLCIALLSVVLWGQYLFYSGSTLVLALPFVVFPAGFFVSPLFHSFVMTQIRGKASAPHFLIPFLFALASILVHILFLLDNAELQSREAILNHSGFLALYTSSYVILAVSFNFAYLGHAIRMILKETGSSVGPAMLTLACTIICYLFVHLAIAALALLDILPRPFHPIEALASVIMAYIFVHVVLRHSSEPVDVAHKKYAKQSLKPSDASRYLRVLKECMESKKPFKEEGITLQDLADRTGIPSHHLSMVINNDLSRNFFTFMNEYRVNEARRLMQNPVYKDYTLLAIGFEAGFQSKAAFNSAFKKHTGMVPGEFRKKINISRSVDK
tara:strand:+ start:9898 stop:10896 length:999 start_codon:yes stop_codon:yes gene_type:complete